VLARASLQSLRFSKAIKCALISPLFIYVILFVGFGFAVSAAFLKAASVGAPLAPFFRIGFPLSLRFWMFL
jgi:hypothetical protein